MKKTMTNVGRTLIGIAAAALAVAPLRAQKEVDRIQNSTTVLKEILAIPDDIPKDLLDRAE